jgi:hypothetical protein
MGLHVPLDRMRRDFELRGVAGQSRPEAEHRPPA